MTDLAAFAGGATRLGANYASDSECRSALPGLVEVRRPVKDEILRLRPGMSCPVNCGEYRKKITLLPGSPLPEARSTPKERLLRIAMNRFGDVFLWPVPLKGALASSMKGLLRDAEEGWVRVRWSKDLGQYEHQPWQLDPQPSWPAATLEQLIAISSPRLFKQYQQEERPHG